jgi:hypothetical protein
MYGLIKSKPIFKIQAKITDGLSHPPARSGNAIRNQKILILYLHDLLYYNEQCHPNNNACQQKRPVFITCRRQCFVDRGDLYCPRRGA